MNSTAQKIFLTLTFTIGATAIAAHGPKHLPNFHSITCLGPLQKETGLANRKGQWVAYYTRGDQTAGGTMVMGLTFYKQRCVDEACHEMLRSGSGTPYFENAAPTVIEAPAGTYTLEISGTADLGHFNLHMDMTSRQGSFSLEGRVPLQNSACVMATD